MASRERREFEVIDADSHSEAWTGILPYGVDGEVAERREVRSVLGVVSRVAWFDG